MSGGWIGKPLRELMRALRGGEVSALALHEEACDRHARFGEALSAYRVWDEEHARAQAEAADAAFRAGEDRGALQGIPVSVKDLFGIDYLDTTAGSPRALPGGWSSEGPVVRAVRAQQAVLTGKTHMVEFAFGGLGTNPHWPTPRNPWDARDHRAPGGSSSGAGVSLMEGSAVIALGTDTAGSVRVPASMTGTVGLKLTAGRWSLGGIVPLSPTLDTPGLLARSVADTAIAFEAIDAACTGRAPRPVAEPADIGAVRIGIAEPHLWDRCPEDIADVVRGAVGEVEKAGARLTAMALPEAGDAFDLFRQGSVVASELNAFLASELPGWRDTLDPNVAFRVSAAFALDSEEIAGRRARLAKLAASAANAMSGIDVIVSPAVPVTAPRLADVTEPKAYSAANLAALSNTCLANILGLCAITIPAGLDASGIPAGLQLMGRAGGEDRLLAIALAFEEHLGTAAERLGEPPLARTA